MSGQWVGGLQVRGLERGKTTVADLYCTACRHHERVTGRARVADYLRANPLGMHRVACQPMTT